MNWARAKTILIIALVLTNIFLLATYFGKEKKQIDQITASTEASIEYMEKAGIKINCEVPQNIERIPVITLSFRKGDIGGALYRTEFEDIPVEIIGMKSGAYINYIEKTEKKIYTLPAYTALLKSFGSVGDQINNIELVYLVDRSEYQGQEGMDTALPYWKVTSAENSYYYSAYSE